MDIYGEEGTVRKRIPATSGKRGVKDSSIPNKGPIPSGKYTISPEKVAENSLRVRLRGDWGNMRAPLEPAKENDMKNRSGFWIHGGADPGSGGCIDLGSAYEEILTKIKKGNSPVAVRVK